jgi:hypothetical protein
MLLASVSLCGCFSLGDTRLYEDQLGYSRALGDAEKNEALLNVVRIRRHSFRRRKSSPATNSSVT